MTCHKLYGIFLAPYIMVLGSSAVFLIVQYLAEVWLIPWLIVASIRYRPDFCFRSKPPSPEVINVGIEANNFGMNTSDIFKDLPTVLSKAQNKCYLDLKGSIQSTFYFWSAQTLFSAFSIISLIVENGAGGTQWEKYCRFGGKLFNSAMLSALYLNMANLLSVSKLFGGGKIDPIQPGDAVSRRLKEGDTVKTVRGFVVSIERVKPIENPLNNDTATDGDKQTEATPQDKNADNAKEQVTYVVKVSDDENGIEKWSEDDTHNPVVELLMPLVLGSSMNYYVSVIVLVLLSLPWLITHIIPGLLLYCWTFVLGVGALYLVVSNFMKAIHKLTCGKYRVNDTLPSLLFMLRVILILLLQTSFNYANLYYSTSGMPAAYIGVISTEFGYRNQLACYFERSFNSFLLGLQFLGFL